MTSLSDISFKVTEKINIADLTLDTFVSADNMNPNFGGISQAVKLPPSGKATRFTVGDILFSKIRPYLNKVWRADRNGGCSQDVMVLRANQANDSWFVYSLLAQQDFTDYVMLSVKGTRMPRADETHVMSYNISLSNRQAVATFSETFSNLEKTIKNQISELEQTAQDLYNYWFVQFDFPDENGNPYRSSGGKMVWNEELKQEIPEGWEVANIASVTVNHDSKRVPLSSKQREAIKGAIPYYGATGIVDHIDKFIFDDQYVLIAEDGSIMRDNGKPVVQMIWGKTWVNNHTHVLEACNGYSNELLYFVLRDISVAKVMTGSIQKKISQRNLNTYPIHRIPEHIAIEFSNVAGSVFSLLRSKQEERLGLTNLKNLILPLLINGQAKITE